MSCAGWDHTGNSVCVAPASYTFSGTESCCVFDFAELDAVATIILAQAPAATLKPSRTQMPELSWGSLRRALRPGRAMEVIHNARLLLFGSCCVREGLGSGLRRQRPRPCTLRCKPLQQSRSQTGQASADAFKELEARAGNAGILRRAELLRRRRCWGWLPAGDMPLCRYLQ